MPRNHPNPNPRMPTEIHQYNTSCADREHPQFHWLLRCECCGSYRDRDEMYEDAFAKECLPCLNKRGIEWVSPDMNNHSLPSKEVLSAPDKTPKTPKVRPRARPEADTPEAAAVRAAMTAAQSDGDVALWMKLHNDLKALQQG